MRKKIATVSIIIPVFNEQNTIEKVINLVKRSNTSGLAKEIIVVDDGSTDQTGRILKKLKQSKNLKVYFNDKNVGKGYSLKKGIQASKGDIVIVQDKLFNSLEVGSFEYEKYKHRQGIEFYAVRKV